MLHVHGIHQKAKRIPSGWQGTLRNAQGGSKETMNTANTGNTVNGLWQPVCHALWNFDSTGLCVLLAGKALCAMHRVGANPTGNTMNTGNTMDGLWHTAGYTLRKFHDTWLTRFPVSSPVFLVFLVFPGGITHSIGSAQCALPANRPHHSCPLGTARKKFESSLGGWACEQYVHQRIHSGKNQHRIRRQRHRLLAVRFQEISFNSV